MVQYNDRHYNTAGAKRQSSRPIRRRVRQERSGEHGIQTRDRGASPGAPQVTILAEGRRINGKSILSILSACIRQGSEIELICSGAGERAALEEAAALIQSRENGE